MAAIAVVGEADLPDLLGLMRGYCDFYKVKPGDDELHALSRALIADPEGRGSQLLARDGDAAPAGFATVFWSSSTLSASRIGVMNDLFVAESARGTGVADELIGACVDLCRDQGGISSLEWCTAPDNLRAQAVYERVGAKREQWVDYSLPID